MQRFTLIFATIIFVISTHFVFGPKVSSQEDDKKAAEGVVRSFEQAVQEYDFDKADSFLTPDARWIESSFPNPVEPWMRRTFQGNKDRKVRIEYHPQDFEVHMNGDTAWVTVTLNSTWTAGPSGKLANGKSEMRRIYVESEVLVRTATGWKIALGHTTSVSPSLGVVPDRTPPNGGGMKFADVLPGGAAERAGFKTGDVLLECGGMKIESLLDFLGLMWGRTIGEKVSVTVLRGQEKITKEVTLDTPK